MTNVWTAVASPNVSSFTYPCGAGTPDNAIIFGCSAASIAPEIFNGTTWITQSGTNIVSMSNAGNAGTPASVLCFKAYPGSAFLWNGTTWSSIADVASSFYIYNNLGGCGTVASAMGAGYAISFTYDGVSWTSKGASGLSSGYPGLVGSPGSAMAMEVGSSATRLWNGAAWSAGGTRITSAGGAGAVGDDSSGVSFGATYCQEWSGTTWSGSSNLLVSISTRAGGAGDESLALAFAVTACKYDTQVLAAPIANFSGTPTSGLAPLTVVFTDLSTNTPTTWDWDWGDGATHGTTQNPTHIFTIPGTFTVTLIATNPYGTDTEAKVAYIGISGTAGAVAVGDKVLIANVKGVPVIVRQ